MLLAASTGIVPEPVAFNVKVCTAPLFKLYVTTAFAEPVIVNNKSSPIQASVFEAVFW